MAQASKIKYHVSGRDIAKRGPLELAEDSQISIKDLDLLGINIMAMDTALVGPALQNGFIESHLLRSMLPGIVRIATRVRVIDEIVGVTNAGQWHDDSVAVNLAEPVGKAELYGDQTNIPLASYRTGLEERGIVRFEQGFSTGPLEVARQQAAGYDATAEKRASAQESLDISRNRVGFFGFAAPTSRTFGLLNDPNLPAYKGATADWSTATFEQITGDLADMFNDIEVQSGGNIREGMPHTLVLPTGYRSILTRANPVATGQTVLQWINENYPNTRIVSGVPEFVGANGGEDVAYLFAETAGDGPDNGNTIIQVVPERYRVLGSENRVKGYIEDATNATAGVFVLRPWAFARRTISGV